MKKNRLLAVLLSLFMLFGFFSGSFDTLIDADAVGQTNILTWSSPGFYTYTIPRSGIWELECWGARGGDDGGGPGGNGSYRSGFFRLEKGTVLKICVGQAGSSGGGIGFNTVGGGGGTGSHGWSGSGGGATWVVTGSSQYLWDYYVGSDEILIVGAGGGGGTCGVQGGYADVYAGNGPFGYGLSKSGDGGGGGGGYYGGADASDGSKTGGGTSYVNTNLGYTGTWSKGSNAGNGMFRISLHGYYIKFNKNTPAITESIVKGSMPDQYMIFGVPDTLQKNTYTLKGYVWQGWTEFPDGTGEQYEDQQLVVDR